VIIDLNELKRRLGDRLAVYGVLRIDAIPDVCDGKEGTVLRFVVGPEFSALIFAAGDNEYPKRMLAMYAEVLMALHEMKVTAQPLMSEPFAVATQLSYGYDEAPYDMLERALLREREGSSFWHVDPFPQDELFALGASDSADEAGGDAADDIAIQMESTPGGAWALTVLSVFRWFMAALDEHWFAFAVTSADYDIVDGIGAATAAEVTMYGRNLMSPDEYDDMVADLVVVLTTDPEDSVELVAA
jgi:hypothetical protein